MLILDWSGSRTCELHTLHVGPHLTNVNYRLTSRILDPIRAAGRIGLFKELINEFDGGVEILDDLDDHWCAKHHKAERNWLVEELQKLAAEHSVRVTILG